eukprot:978292-Prorocentrum_minimum.AAC.5
MDSHGCGTWGESDASRIRVQFTGPYNFTGAITGLGDGAYLVSYVPEAPGKYMASVTVDGLPVKDGEFCYEVRGGRKGGEKGISTPPSRGPSGTQ